ncbi:hypothetical protein GGP77_003592, partial [Salinibacter ruber]|nr:hypothetical protein [Salinibacter ruber]
MRRYHQIALFALFVLPLAGSGSAFAQDQELEPTDQIPEEGSDEAVLVDTVYVIEARSLSKAQRNVLPDSVSLQVEAKQTPEGSSPLEISNEHKASLDAIGESYTVLEKGLRYRKAAEESVSEEDEDGPMPIPDEEGSDTNAALDVDVTDGPSDATASRIKYTWDIDHDDVRDVDARMGTYGWSEGGGWNDGFEDVPKTSENTFGYDEESESSRESQVSQDDQPVNQRWAFVANDRDDDGNKGEISWVELTVYYQVQQETTLDLSLSDDDPAWGEEVTLTAQLYVDNYFGNTYPSGREVEISVAGETKTDQTNSDGKATVTIDAPESVGSYDVEASFDGDDSYTSSNAERNGEITTQKHATRVAELSDATAQKGGSVELSAKLLDDGPVGEYEDGGVEGRTIIFYQETTGGCESVGSWDGCDEIGRDETDPYGEATITYEDVELKQGKTETTDYEIYARFKGDDKYKADYAEATLSIEEKSQTTLEITDISPDEPGWGGPVDITAQLSESGFGGDNISGREVDITLAGDTKSADTEDGKATVTIDAPESVGSYDVEASFDGDDSYTSSNAERNGEITTQKHATRVAELSDATAQKGGSVELSAKLLDDGPVGEYEDGGVEGRTIIFYQETTGGCESVGSWDGCDEIGRDETDPYGEATITYEDVELKQGKTETTDYEIYARFKGDDKYKADYAEATLSIEEKEPKPILSKAQDPLTRNEDGTIIVRVEADPNGGTLKQVSAHYQPTGCFAVGDEATVSLSQNSNGVWQGILPDGADSYEPCHLEEFTDETEVKYRFTATSENEKTAEYPTDQTYKTVEAQNGDVPQRLAVTGSGKNLADIQVEKISESGDRVTSKVTLTNQTFLYWGAKIRKNGDPIQSPDVDQDNWGTVASGLAAVAGLDGASDAYMAGNRYDIAAFGVDQKSISFEVTTKPEDDVTLTLERTHWTTDVLSLLQITRNVADVLKRRIAKEKSLEDPGLRKLAAMPPGKQAKFIDSVVNAFGKALLKRVADDLESESETLTEYPKLYDALTGRSEIPGRLTLLKKMGSYSIGLLQDKGFYKSVLDELADSGTGNDRVDSVLNSIKSLLGSFSATVKATEGLVTGVSLGQNIYEALTLPGKSYLSMKHRSLLDVDPGVHGPRRVKASSYPAGPEGQLRDSLSQWLTVNPDPQKEQIRIRVHNPADAQALDNVWIGADLWTSSGGDEDAATPGQKIENTLTPIADSATDKKGNLDFQAFQCESRACNQTTRLEGDATAGDFGQGVRLKTGETIEFRADYAFSESVTGHTFQPGTYFLRYRVWYNGYPGSSTGEAVTPLRTRRVHVTDDKRPQAPLADKYPSRPFRLSAVQNETGTVLTWIRNNGDRDEVSDVSFEPDVSLYHIERALASGGTFSTVQWISARKSRFVDRQATSGENYRYRITALDNAGRRSAVSGMTNTVPPEPPTQVALKAGNQQVEVSWTVPSSEDVVGYRIYRDSESFQSRSEAVRVNNGLIREETSYTDSGLENGTTYHYSVVAVDRTGDESALSAVKSETPVDIGNAPTVASDIDDQTIAKEGGSFEADLTTVFSNPLGASSDLRFEAKSDGESVASASVEGTTLSVISEGETGTATVRAAASNRAGETPEVFDVTVDEVPETPCPVAWSAEVTGTSDGTGQTLTFGQSADATTGLDEACGETTLPPTPPSGAFDLRFTDGGLSGVDFGGKTTRTDLRPTVEGLAQDRTWRFSVQAPSGQATLSWDAAAVRQAVSGRQVLLVDQATGGDVLSANMKQSSSATVSASSLALEIRIRTTLTQTLSVSRGWNMVGMPVQAGASGEKGLGAALPGGCESPYRWRPAQGAYQELGSGKTLAPGGGAWT